MTVEDARATLDALNEKLAAATARMIDIQAESRSLSLPAMTGDVAAGKRLNELNRACAANEIETRNINSAIEAQKAIVARVEHDEERALARQDALCERDEIEKTRALAAKLRSSIDTLVEGLPQLLDRLSAHKKRGFLTSNGTWTAVIIRSISHRLFHAFRPLGTDYFRVSAPGDVHPIDETVEAHLAGGLRKIEAVLGEQNREAA